MTCRGSTELELLLFSHEFDYAAAAMAAGMSGIIVDWEYSGKSERQNGWNTEINRGTEADLIAMRERISGWLICRISNEPHLRTRQARRAAELGADEVWLPMVRSIAEVEECLKVLEGRCALGILSETQATIDLTAELGRLPLSRIYIGLNDLQIDRRAENLFLPLCDGTVDTFRQHYRGALGFAGVTRPELGRPVPCWLLLAEMALHGCRFAVARRSFRADVPLNDIGAALRAIRQCYAELLRRDRAAIAADHEELRRYVTQLLAAPVTSAQI